MHVVVVNLVMKDGKVKIIVVQNKGRIVAVLIIGIIVEINHFNTHFRNVQGFIIMKHL
jgi:hypothetical protein